MFAGDASSFTVVGNKYKVSQLLLPAFVYASTVLVWVIDKAILFLSISTSNSSTFSTWFNFKTPVKKLDF